MVFEANHRNIQIDIRQIRYEEIKTASRREILVVRNRSEAIPIVASIVPSIEGIFVIRVSFPRRGTYQSSLNRIRDTWSERHTTSGLSEHGSRQRLDRKCSSRVYYQFPQTAPGKSPQGYTTQFS